MMLRDFHMHTTFCDGKNSAEEMVLAAMEKGFDYIGFSDHAPMNFDDGCAMPEAALPAYAAEILRLKEKYKDHIRDDRKQIELVAFNLYSSVTFMKNIPFKILYSMLT